MPFTELVPKLLAEGSCDYILCEVFSQDLIEMYFSRQRHCGGSSENPTVQQFYDNSATLMQQRHVYRDVRTMNVLPGELNEQDKVEMPLQKRKRISK